VNTVNGKVEGVHWRIYPCKNGSFASLITSQWLKIDCRISPSTFGHNWPTQQRGLCDSWATCIISTWKGKEKVLIVFEKSGPLNGLFVG